MTTTDFTYLTYAMTEQAGVLRITLNRPNARNAQNRGLLVELDRAFAQAEYDDDVRVIILSGAGKDFSSGHDLGTKEYKAERTPGPDLHPSFEGHGNTKADLIESRYNQEWQYFFNNTRRWRELKKITIAQVHGSVYSAALMLAWCCDLIVAAEDTRFADVVGARLGMQGVEYFAHPWEFGPRKAKELLLTGDAIDADDAYSLGMVSKVFTHDEIEEKTEEFAARIAAVPTFSATLIKDSVNIAQDAMGFTQALQAAYGLHQLNHAQWSQLTEGRNVVGTPEYGLPDWRTIGAPRRADRSTP